MKKPNRFEEGIIFGKFAPLTQGHINFINSASLECDKLYVFLSFDEKFLEKQSKRDQKRLSLKNRMLWLKHTYKDMPHIEIKFVNETNLPPYPNGWKAYTNLIKAHFPNGFKENSAVFTSEPEYDEQLKIHFPDLEHVIIDFERTQVPISATKIRNNIYEYWGMIPSIVRKDYTLKVCVVGTESSGKTTLVKYLAKLYNTSWAEEFGRKYVMENLCGDDSLLSTDDFLKIAYEHKVLEDKSLLTANKISFIDSNAMITEFYHRLHLNESNPVICEMAKREEYDLIIYMSDEVPWCADELRRNESNRQEVKEKFESLLEEFPNQKEKVVYVKGTNYKERFERARIEVEKLLNTFQVGEHE